MGVFASIGYTDYYNVVHKVDIDLTGYVGSITELTGTTEPIIVEYERLNTSQIFSTQLTKANVTIGFYVDESASLAVVSALIAAIEGNYKLLYYKGGVLDLTVDVIADQITFNESSAGRTATVTGKDFSNLSSKTFPLSDVRKPIIEVIADCLKLTGYDLPITTCTSWVNEDQANLANDFLRELRIDTIALREYANEQTDSDSAIGATDALTYLLRNFKLYLKQADGRFYLDQLSAYTNPASVLRTLYDKDGVFVSASTLSKSVAVPNVSPYRALLGQSENTPISSFKRVKSLFNHRLVPSGIVMPQSINFAQLDILPRSFGQEFIPNNERRLSFSSNVQVNTTTQIPNGSGIQIEVRSGDRWWNIQTQQWVSTVGLRNDFTLSDLTFTQPNNPPPDPPIVALGQLSDFVYTTVVTINTTPIPTIGGGAITITLYPYEGQPSTTTYTGAEFSIVGIFGEQLQTAEAFELEQSLNSSVSYDDGAVLYGDGPTAEANSAIRFSTVDTDITVGGWYRRGGAQDWTFPEILLKEIMEFQRSFVRSVSAVILGDFRATDIPIYDSTAFYFIGGSHDIYNGQWGANIVAIAFADATDSLNVNLISGPALLSTGFYSAINQSIGKTLEAGGMIAFRLATAITPGTVSTITISGTLGNDYLFRTGNSIKVVHPVTGQSLDLTVGANQAQGSNIIVVDLVSVDYTFPISSWVFVSQETITTSITILRDQIELFSRSSAVGALTANVAGTVTSVEINLWAQIREGDDLLIVNPLLAEPIPIFIRGSYDNGVRTVDITETIVNAPLGAYVIRSGSQTQAQFFVDPGRLEGTVSATKRENAIAVLNGDLAIGTYTSIPVTGVKSLTIQNDSILAIDDRLGNIVEVVVNGEQALTGASSSITVDSFTTTEILTSGASVKQPDYNATGQISVQAGTVVLKATTSSGSINKLALVRLDATAASGSTILLQADQITVAGQATFLSALRSNGIAGKGDVNATIRSTTAPTVRADGSALVAGDTWIKTNEGNLPYTWSGSSWIRDYTIIDGGNITTGTINANLVTVTAASGNVVIGSSGITGGSGATAFTLNGTGLFLGQFAGIRAMFERTSITLETDAAPTENKAVFARTGLSFFKASSNANPSAFVNETEIRLRTETGDTTTVVITAQTGIASFSGVVSVANATADGHALNRITADGRYVPITASQEIAGTKTFTSILRIKPSGSDGYLQFNFVSANNRTLNIPDPQANGCIVTSRVNTTYFDLLETTTAFTQSHRLSFFRNGILYYIPLEIDT